MRAIRERSRSVATDLICSACALESTASPIRRSRQEHLERIDVGDVARRSRTSSGAAAAAVYIGCAPAAAAAETAVAGTRPGAASVPPSARIDWPGRRSLS
jgi:hypothetical protein